MVCKDSANRMQSVKLAWTLCWDAAYFLQRYLFLLFAKPDYLRFNLKLLVIARIRFATSWWRWKNNLVWFEPHIFWDVFFTRRGSIAGYMTDERDENSQKDEAGTLLGCYISYSNRTKLLFYRHLMRQSSMVNNRLENLPTAWGTEPPNVGFHSPR